MGVDYETRLEAKRNKTYWKRGALESRMEVTGDKDTGKERSWGRRGGREMTNFA